MFVMYDSYIRVRYIKGKFTPNMHNREENMFCQNSDRIEQEWDSWKAKPDLDVWCADC